MKVEIDISEEAIEEIVLRELKMDYAMNNRFEQDPELADALITVIKYHSTDDQYADWIASHKKVCCESHGGPVGLHCNHDHCTGPKWVEKNV
jgi:hypothetical protein